MQLINFLKLVLPEEGKKCCAVIPPNKKVSHFFADSFETLAQAIELANSKDVDTYFACASFGDEHRRTSNNALFCKAFWMDIDIGKGKDYDSKDIAVSALDSFCNALDLPLPLLVCSGRGIHAYWPLLSAVPASEWVRVAKDFKRVAEARGFRADPSRTADAASILRPPGTRNFKQQPPLSVYIEDENYELISFEDFEARVRERPVASTVSLNASLSKPQKQLTNVVEGGRNNAIASLAGICFAKGMSFEATLNECLGANKTYQPAPLDYQEVLTTVKSIERKQIEKIKEAKPPEDGYFKIPAPFQNFEIKSNMLVLSQKDENGNTTYEVLAPHPVYLADVCRREREIYQSYVFHSYHPHNGWHEFSVPAKDFDTPAWKSLMTHNGVKVRSKLFKTYVEAMEVKFMNEKADGIQYEQFGWKNDYSEFLIGNVLIGKGGKTRIAYGSNQLTARMEGFKLLPGSSLEGWQTPANKLFSTGFEPHSLAVIASFASVLMPFVCGETDGGAILSLYSMNSGLGKTNSLEAVASVWGAYSALSTIGKDTNNAKFNIIATLCNLPTVEDELTLRDPVKTVEFIKEYTMGRDKNRANREGSVIMKSNRYQNILLSASNFSLYELAKQGGDAGAVARVFELSFDYPDKEAFKTFGRISAEMLRNRGWAGRTFLHHLMQQNVLDWAKAEVEKSLDFYIRHLETSSEHRYIARLMAVCSVTARLLSKYNILNFDSDRIIDWASGKAKVRVLDKINKDPVEVLNLFIRENIHGCIVASGPHHPKVPCTIARYPSDRQVTMRWEKEPARLFVCTDAFRKWLKTNTYPFDNTEQGLMKEGVLLERRRLTTVTAGSELPPVRVTCWEIDINHPAMANALSLEAEIPPQNIKALKI